MFQNEIDSIVYPFFPKDINYSVWKIITSIDSDIGSSTNKKQIEDQLKSCFLDFSNHPYCIQASIYYSKKLDNSTNLNLYIEILKISDYFHGNKYQ